MALKVSHKKLSEVFHHLQSLSEKQPITFELLIRELDEQGHAFLIIILAFPFLLPIPVPGLSTLFGLLITMVAIAWVRDVPPWFPKKVLQTQLPNSLIQQGPKYAEKIFRMIEFLLKPRLLFLLKMVLFRIVVALVMIACALFLALPLPPGTNFPPALIIFTLALGMLENDGLVLLLGIALFIGALFLAHELVGYLQSFLAYF